MLRIVPRPDDVMKIKEILKATDGRLVSGDPDLDVRPSGFSTDSRTIKKGDFFIAIKGPNFDGHDFAEGALKKGAVGAIISTGRPLPTALAHQGARSRRTKTRAIIQVRDTLKAYGDIARSHRIKFRLPVIAITGSNGKTTVKEMIWSIFSCKHRVLKSEGTKNNHIGLPQTLLQLTYDHEIAALEIGMNHRGEIDNLTKIAIPTIGVITNIGPSHLEHLGSLKNVYLAKKELLDNLPPKGVAVLNGDDKFLSKIRRRRFKIVTFGLKEGCDFRATVVSSSNHGLKFLLNDKEEFELRVSGRHNVYNALAALAAASIFGISFKTMRKALERHRPHPMRLARRMVGGVEILDDCYNSNPLSIRCAMEALKDFDVGGKRIIVSSDMLELGPKRKMFHRKLGEVIAKSNIDVLLTLGELSKETHEAAKRHGMKRSNVEHFGTHAELATRLKEVAGSGDIVLIKGSRAMRMEESLKCFIACYSR